jgi:Band 3 cytoplasmic domain
MTRFSSVTTGSSHPPPIATSPSSGSMVRNPSGTEVGNGDVHKVRLSVTFHSLAAELFFKFFFQGNTPFLKKIPAGAEASNVLVGEVDFLDKPVSAFIRLTNAFVLGDLTEVPVPTRFIFILLGPVVTVQFHFWSKFSR